jgi:hypothetical protein
MRAFLSDPIVAARRAALFCSDLDSEFDGRFVRTLLDGGYWPIPPFRDCMVSLDEN